MRHRFNMLSSSVPTLSRVRAMRLAAALSTISGTCGSALGDGVVPGPVADAALAALVTPRDGILNLRTGDVDTAALPNWLALDAFPAGSRRAVMVLHGPMDPGSRAMLTNLGVELLGYLPTNAFIADLSRATPGAVAATGLVRWAGAYDSAWKIDPSLLAPIAFETAERQAMEAQGLVATNLWLFDGEDAQGVIARVTNIPRASVTGLTEMSGGHCVHAIIPRERIEGLASWSELQFAEPLPEYLPRSNTLVRAIVQSGTTTLTPFYSRNIIGTGQIMGIIDGAADIAHCSFADAINPVGPLHRKVLAYNTSLGTDTHGTHVAGTAVGNAGSANDTRGVAYGARMVFNVHPFPSESSMYARLSLHASQGARVHSNSWGSNSRAYDGGCRAIDTLQFEDEENLILFAVANSGLVVNPENAKNCLAVAATRGGTQTNLFCSGSLGPTADGRRKPEVMAPGCSTLSAGAGSACSLLSLTGTSMATPAVSGLATLLREYFMSGFYPSGLANPADAMTPSGSLMRAMLVNSATDVTGIDGSPSNQEGWGRVVGDSVAYFDGDARRLIVRDVRHNAGGLETGERIDFDIDVVASSQPLRLTLAYADAPAAVNAAFTPINNLNLLVEAPDGTRYAGNNIIGGVSLPGEVFDALNNLEVVSLPTPIAGRWTISIIAAAVNVGPQGYAIAITGDVAEVTCDGDFNQDENVDLLDAQQLAQVVVGIISPDPSWLDGDFNGDENVDLLDAQQLAQFVVMGGGCP
jgi:subtilisin family serine protease